MRSGRFLWCVVLASLGSASGCAQALLGDDEYVHDGDASGGGGGGGAGGGYKTGPVACNNGLAACGLACVDLESDPHHCGRCDRVCGSPCDQGLCEPVPVASQVEDPRAIAIDDTHVYWTTAGGAVQRAPKAGGPVQTIAEDQESPATIVVDDKRAYWLNSGTGVVMRQFKDGKAKPMMLSSGMGARGLAQDPSSIYFSRKVKKGDIRVVPKGGGAPVNLALQQPLPADLHVRGETLFWSGHADDDDDLNGNSIPDGEEGLSGGYVRSMPRLGPEGILTLAQAEGEISALTTLAGVPVWADRTYTRIRAYSSDQGGPITLVPDQDVRGLTSDEDAIYWTTAGGNVKSRSAQGATAIIALDIAKAGPLVVDATHVYLLRTGPSGAVLRVAK